MKRILTFEKEAMLELAEKDFIRACGFDLDKPKHKRMWEEGIQYRDSGTENIDIRCKLIRCGRDVFQGNKIIYGGLELACNAFSQIKEDSVQDVYLYALTIGEVSYENVDPIMKQLYSDIWGTAFTDAARLILEGQLREEIGEGLELSDSFGPGFYGMPMNYMSALDQMINMEEIGIKLHKSGVMVPVKSVAGAYLVVKNKDDLPAGRCTECIGSLKSCEFCRFYKSEI